MTSLLTPPPRCISCLRRATNPFCSPTFSPFVALQQHARGKKKVAKPNNTVKVQLLKDLPRYGRTGTIIPIAAGRMRNAWFPFGIATYITEAQLRSNSSLVVSERDFNFSGETPRLQVSPSPFSPTTDPDHIPPPAPAKLVLLTPQRATRLLSTILPARLEFNRTPIPSNPTSVARPSQATDTHKDVDELSPTTNPRFPPEAVAIYGSVSAADVASAIRVWLSVSEEASRIVLAAEDVRFVRKKDESLVSGAQIETEDAGTWEGSKIKELGEFDIEICVKGASDVVRRIVAVLPQDG